MTQKTAMQELLKHFIDAWSSPSDTFNPAMVIEKVESMLPKERQDLIDFHVETMKVGLIGEGERKWSDGYEPLIRATAEKSVHEKFGI